MVRPLVAPPGPLVRRRQGCGRSCRGGRNGGRRPDAAHPRHDPRSTIELFQRGGHDGSLSRCTQEAEVPRADTPRRSRHASQRRDCSSSSASWCRSSSTTSPRRPFNATTIAPAALPAATPGSLSSTTRRRDACTPSVALAARKPCGSGFPAVTSSEGHQRLVGGARRRSSRAVARRPIGTRDDGPLQAVALHRGYQLMGTAPRCRHRPGRRTAAPAVRAADAPIAASSRSGSNRRTVDAAGLPWAMASTLAGSTPVFAGPHRPRPAPPRRRSRRGCRPCRAARPPRHPPPPSQHAGPPTSVGASIPLVATASRMWMRAVETGQRAHHGDLDADRLIAGRLDRLEDALRDPDCGALAA